MLCYVVWCDVLYIKVLAENDDMGENPQLNEAFRETPQTINAIQCSTPLHKPPHTDVIYVVNKRDSNSCTYMINFPRPSHNWYHLKIPLASL